jgi:signal peptidase I
MNPSQNTRYPWLAALLSLLIPGLGQLYCGKIVKCFCIAALIAVFSLLSIMVLTLNLQGRDELVIIFQAASLLLYGIGVIDAYLTARKLRNGYQLKDYNNWFVYALFCITLSGGYVFASLYLRDNLFQPFRVPNSSMFPAIWPGDQLLAAKNVYLSQDPKRGDIVIFRNPEDRRIFLLKRVVALGGDSVEIRDGEVFINGTLLKREAVSPPANIPAGVPKEKYFEEWNGNTSYQILLSTQPAPALEQFPRMVVPKNTCFVLGDNRDISLDSRTLGPIPIVSIVGRATFIYAPADKWSRFGTIR